MSDSGAWAPTGRDQTSEDFSSIPEAERAGDAGGAEREQGSPLPAPALVPEDGRYEGLVVFRGEVLIEGAVKGYVAGQGHVLLARGASLEGEIEVDRLSLAGRIHGEVRARRLVALAPSARLRGRVETPSLTIAEGAVLDADCRIPAATRETTPDPGRR